MSTFTLPLDYEKQENFCKSPLFIYGCKPSRGETLAVFM